MENNIPKIIHFCWFGNGKKSNLIERCIESWKKNCPNYEIKEWNEQNFDVNMNQYVKEAYENKKWAFVSDYARLWAVYNYGGIYLDTDVELIKNLDNLLKYEAFFASQDNKIINTGIGFGGKEKNRVVKELLNSYDKIHFVIDGKMDLKPCTHRNTETLEKIYKCKNLPINNALDDNVVFLSQDFFCPFDAITGKMNKTVNTLGIHWFSGSWRNKKTNIREKMLRPIKRLVGLDNFNKIFKGKQINKEYVGIVTIYDNNNYGNRLQAYALGKTIEKLGKSVIYINDNPDSLYFKTRKLLKRVLKRKQEEIDTDRLSKFVEFSGRMNNAFCIYQFIHKRINKNIDKKVLMYIAGSDQVWNINEKHGPNEKYLLSFTKNKLKYSYAASFGRQQIPEKFYGKYKRELKKFKKISVREYNGKNIIKEIMGTNNTQVLIDPTMLLSDNEWNQIAAKPEKLGNEKYILNYFLGDIPVERKNEIDKIAKENNCKIINILDKNDPFYKTGPSEFLYLEKNAFLICTDSFHSCVFAILYSTPFVVFNREGKGANMNSRIETLLKKFNLDNKFFDGELNLEYARKYNNTEVKSILEEERKKSMEFLDDIIKIKEDK